MTPLWWMAGAGATTWLGVTALLEWRAEPELFCGMLGPLVAVSWTWVQVKRTYTVAPERVMKVMTSSLFAKMAFFGAYVVIALRVLSLRPTPFVISFTSYFVGLYVLEALFLRRLFADGMSPSR